MLIDINYLLFDGSGGRDVILGVSCIFGWLLVELNIFFTVLNGFGEGRFGDVGIISICEFWVEERILFFFLRCCVNRNFNVLLDLGV